jgi:hypothetical protein
MLDNDRSDHWGDDDPAGDRGPVCIDLVPLKPTTHRSSKRQPPRPDPSFVAQLIATATLAPQTRMLRRASCADAEQAYHVRPQERRSVTRRTRQII